MKKFVYIISMLLICCQALAHKHDYQHVEEMYSVLPFATGRNGEWLAENMTIREMLQDITQKLIDDYNRVEIKEYGNRTFYQYLKDEFAYKLSFGDHRILFHWGFNANPWNEQLNTFVINEKWSPEKVNAFKTALLSEQKRRNGIANKMAEDVFGFASRGKEAGWANGILAVIYDVHLLGDYVIGDNSNFKGVTPPSKVSGDIIESIRRIDSHSGRRLIEDIRKTTIENKNEHELAAALIKLLQKEFPDFLLKANDGALKKRFEVKGYKLKKPFINFS